MGDPQRWNGRGSFHISRRRRRALELDAQIRRWQISDDGSWHPYPWINALLSALPIAGIPVALLVVAMYSTVGNDAANNELAQTSTSLQIATMDIALLSVYLIIIWPARRKRAYRLFCATMYFGRLAALSRWTRWRGLWFINEEAGDTLAGGGADRARERQRRLRDANRWARQQLTAQLIVAGALAFIPAGDLIWWAWHFGIVHSSVALSPADARTMAWRDVLWNAAHSVPLFDLTEALNWARPGAFTSSRPASMLVFVSKLAIFVPTISAVIALFRAKMLDPEEPAAHDPATTALIDALARSGKGREFDWPAALESIGIDR